MTVIHNHCIKCIFNNKNRFHKIMVVNNYFLNYTIHDKKQPLGLMLSYYHKIEN